ncbi:probable protein S-acyltransferase 23 isoform X2 [Centruroides sculpturatus]|nr:probable protein S-acyltransferase 23 isoform X2 [Centruroides sculpturatus]
MVEQGVDVDVPSYSPQGSHPIHWACAKGHISVVDILLQAKVSVDVCDARGRSPLIIASQHGYIHLVGYLLGRGANRHLCDNNGDTALHWAAYKGFPEIMRLLIYSGCNPEQQDSYGQTPLHLACLNGNYIVVQDLCEKDKVKIEVSDKEGRTPLILAEIKRHSDVIDYLENELRLRRRLFPRFNIWQLAFGPAGKSKGPLLFFLCSLLFWGYPMYLLRCVPLTWDDIPLIHWFFIVTNTVMWLSMVVAHTRNPGYLKQNTDEYHYAIRQMAHFDKWKERQSPMTRLCHTCRTVRPLRAKHCRICNRCVIHFDHHCPYIYNCVGLYNRVWFLIFCSCVAINCTVTVYFAFVCIIKEGWLYCYIAGLLEAIMFCGLGWMLTGSTLLYAAYNLTTNEAFNYKRYGYLMDSKGHYHNPFSRGLLENFKEYFHCTRIWDVNDIELKKEEVV